MGVKATSMRPKSFKIEKRPLCKNYIQWSDVQSLEDETERSTRR